MSLNNLTQNEIDGMTLADLAYSLLKNDGECNTASLYKKITKLKKMTKAEYEDTIADFFAILNTDRRFSLLNNGIWGLRENHPLKSDFEEILNDEDTEALIDEETEHEEAEEEIELFITDEDEFDDNDDMADLVIIDEDELEQE